MDRLRQNVWAAVQPIHSSKWRVKSARFRNLCGRIEGERPISHDLFRYVDICEGILSIKNARY
jgi:hypothetical protein